MKALIFSNAILRGSENESGLGKEARPATGMLLDACYNVRSPEAGPKHLNIPSNMMHSNPTLPPTLDVHLDLRHCEIQWLSGGLLYHFHAKTFSALSCGAASDLAAWQRFQGHTFCM